MSMPLEAKISLVLMSILLRCLEARGVLLGLRRGEKEGEVGEVGMGRGFWRRLRKKVVKDWWMCWP